MKVVKACKHQKNMLNINSDVVVFIGGI